MSRIAQSGSRIGLHRPYFEDSSRATENGYDGFKRNYDAILTVHRDFFSEMGIGDRLIEIMSSIRSNDIAWITPETARQLGLLGDDPTYQEWMRAKRIAEKGRACVEWQDHLMQCYR